MDFRLRLAEAGDTPALQALIEASVRGLQASDYSPEQIDESLKSVYGVDTQLIADKTYFVVEADTANALLIVGCGGWSKRRTLYGGDQWIGREPQLLDPLQDAAKIRAFFVHPLWTRRGIGTLILDACEAAAVAAGFTRLEMGATLTGVALYQARGYAPLENLAVPLSRGLSLPIVRMGKQIKPRHNNPK
jgi:GNAT superfamily N-acetyltransferase